MWQKNNGKSESEIVQNLFTAYLTTAVKRQHVQEQGAEEDMFRGLPLPMQLEDSAFLYALKGINERERHVFLARVLDERSFESLAEEMGLGYKGVATIYYRAIGKIKKKMKELRK